MNFVKARVTSSIFYNSEILILNDIFIFGLFHCATKTTNKAFSPEERFLDIISFFIVLKNNNLRYFPKKIYNIL